MIHIHTEVRRVNDIIGHGVFATAPIPAGTIVYAWDELEIEILPDDERLLNPTLAAQIERYSYIDQRGVRIISWDHAKFVNHSCSPNTMSTGYGFEIAVRDIAADEQITDEYGMFNLPLPMQISCCDQDCRGVITSDDLLHHATSWDEQIRSVLPLIHSVEQPLWDLVAPETRRALEAFTDNGTYQSVSSLRYLQPANGKRSNVAHDASARRVRDRMH